MAAEGTARRSGRLGRLGSVRARTTLTAGLVVGLSLLIAALLAMSALRHSLVRGADKSTITRAEDIAALAIQGDLPERLSEADLKDDDDGLVQVVDGRGRVLAASANLAGRAPVSKLRPGEGERMVQTMHGVGPHTDDFRLAAVSAQTASGTVYVYAATNLDFVGETTRVLRGILIVGIPALLVLLVLITWLLVGRALHPVEQIRSQVASISARALDRRVPEPPVDDEIARLAKTMNAMLDRLETANDRQRRFVSDASHELRSPLAVARAQLEVALAHPGSSDWETTAAQLLAENLRMERLVDDLLFLARSDHSRAPLRREPVDLDDLVLEEVARLQANGGGRVRFDTHRVEAARVNGDPEALRRAIRNLLENAQRHTTTTVRLETSVNGAGATLVVADDGPGIPEESRERVFDRFTRLDSGRSREEGGTGLGLSIVREIVQHHHGAVAVEPLPATRGARFVVRLPDPG